MNEVISQDIEWLIQNVNWKKFANQKILITGANGSIARYLVYFFMELCKRHAAGCEIHVLIRNLEKAQQLFGEYYDEKNFYVHTGNVEENGVLAHDMNYVFHAAGIAATRMFDVCPVEVLKTNMLGTYNLLNYLKENRKIKKFVFFSSGAVYGLVTEPYNASNEQVFFPLDPLGTGACYAEGKRVGETLCHSFWRQYKVPTVMVRIGHTYGPGIDLKAGHVYDDFVDGIVHKRDIEIRNPDAVRSFTYVRDVIYGILIVSLSEESGQAYNLWNTGCRMPIGKLADYLARTVFRERKLKVYWQKMEYFYDINNDKKIGNTISDTVKIEKLGWKPEVGIEEGFMRTVKSFEI